MRNGAGWALFLEFDGTLVESCNADLVVLHSIEAIRLRATRLVVIRRGTLLAESEPQLTRLSLSAGPAPSTPRNTRSEGRPDSLGEPPLAREALLLFSSTSRPEGSKRTSQRATL